MTNLDFIEPYDASFETLLVVRKLLRQSERELATEYYIKKFVQEIKNNRPKIKESLEYMKKVEASHYEHAKNVDWDRVIRESLNFYHDN